MKPEHFDDPVAAYDRLAPNYEDLAGKRTPYLHAIENNIISRIPTCRSSLLDIGAGDGMRASRIAAEAGIKHIVLLEPSADMRVGALEGSNSRTDANTQSSTAAGSSRGAAAYFSAGRKPWVAAESDRVPKGRQIICHENDEIPKEMSRVEIWPIRAEDLSSESISERFDVITCLWNVLGHIQTAEKRTHALSTIARLLSPRGKFFLDVNHRYNLRSYGALPTVTRWIHDCFFRDEKNDDVTAKWNVGEATISTYGHVFTHREITHLASAAGLELEERVVVDYEDGRLRRFSFMGNLLYIFRRSSGMDSSSTPQTS